MKILLIDDEYYFRQALKNMLSQTGLDLEICGEARDGEEGLLIVEEERPEIVLADINMPLMDGLTFIDEAKKIQPQIKFVIITGYNNFDYAKRAISLGVRNYLLKPIEQEELTDTLRTIMQELYSERKKNEDLEVLQKLHKTASQQQRKSILYDILTGNQDFVRKYEQDQIQRYGIRLESSFCVAVCAIARNETESESITDKLADEIENKVSNFLSRDSKIYILNEDDGKLGIIYNFEDEEAWKENIQNIMTEVINALPGKSTRWIFGVGNHYRGQQKVYLSYQEAEQTCYQQLLYGCRQVFYENREFKEIQFLTEEKRILLESYLNVANFAGIEQILEQIGTEVREACLNRSNLLLLAVELLNPCFHYARKNKQDEILQEYFEFLLGKLQQRKTAEQIFAYIQSVYQASVSESECRIQKKSDVTIRTLEYIHENFTDNELTVERISKAVFANNSYLCCVFKKEVGVTINKYILKIRLMDAKERMENGEEYVKKIALECGFANESYFGKCFRNEFLMTPSEYIRMVGAKKKEFY